MKFAVPIVVAINFQAGLLVPITTLQAQ